MPEQDFHIEHPTINSYEEWLEFEPCVRLIPRDVILELCVRLSHWVPGHIMEFGVWRGTSTRVIRRMLTKCKLAEFGSPSKNIYGCDSFEGLPEPFAELEAGAFALDRPPRILGVTMVKGFFEDSLTPELAKKVGRVSFASLDADLYSSTECVLKWLTPLLGPGSLLLFDQFEGEGGAEKEAGVRGLESRDGNADDHARDIHPRSQRSWFEPGHAGALSGGRGRRGQSDPEILGFRHAGQAANRHWLRTIRGQVVAHSPLGQVHSTPPLRA